MKKTQPTIQPTKPTQTNQNKAKNHNSFLVKLSKIFFLVLGFVAAEQFSYYILTLVHNL